MSCALDLVSISKNGNDHTFPLLLRCPINFPAITVRVATGGSYVERSVSQVQLFRVDLSKRTRQSLSCHHCLTTIYFLYLVPLLSMRLGRKSGKFYWTSQITDNGEQIRRSSMNSAIWIKFVSGTHSCKAFLQLSVDIQLRITLSTQLLDDFDGPK